MINITISISCNFPASFDRKKCKQHIIKLKISSDLITLSDPRHKEISLVFIHSLS